ncbi:hypothetical protein SAMN05444359_1316 [Neolewinella agarilytica]|uniref:Uncharacterized protein n=1 Tax=Neolewinella agarilytica TaxID=478744 RepID=A0A1H9MR03_9BACT|nr:hypothetical protein SAMN05444359_1316 [Neolewinella agarilytica]
MPLFPCDSSYNSDLKGSMSTTYGGKDEKKTFYSPSLSKFVGGDFFYMPSPQFLLKHSALLPS